MAEDVDQLGRSQSALGDVGPVDTGAAVGPDDAPLDAQDLVSFVLLDADGREPAGHQHSLQLVGDKLVESGVVFVLAVLVQVVEVVVQTY